MPCIMITTFGVHRLQGYYPHASILCYCGSAALEVHLRACVHVSVVRTFYDDMVYTPYSNQ